MDPMDPLQLYLDSIANPQDNTTPPNPPGPAIDHQLEPPPPPQIVGVPLDDIQVIIDGARIKF